MGCDYYIAKWLVVYFNDDDWFSIELEGREKAYYMHPYDEDEEDYEEKVEAYKKRCLLPQMEPIVLYENGCFRNAQLEAKYKKQVEVEMTKIGKTWLNVTKMVKEEWRYERE